MSGKPDLAWLKDRNVIVFGIGCAVAGFLVALLIFGEPWHLPPAWGDIPTWLTALVGGVAAWFVYGQLKQQAKALNQEFKRNIDRDKLLDGQLRELADRERARQREQAVLVRLTAMPVRNPQGPDVVTGKQAERHGICEIANDSWRPIRRVACRLSLDTREIRATGFRIPRGMPSAPIREDEVDLTAGEFLNLKAEQTLIAIFGLPDDIQSFQKARYVIRFTDDTDLRWELDGDMSLARAPDAAW